MSALLEVESLSKHYPVFERRLFRARQRSEIRAMGAHPFSDGRARGSTRAKARAHPCPDTMFIFCVSAQQT